MRITNRCSSRLEGRLDLAGRFPIPIGPGGSGGATELCVRRSENEATVG